MNAQPHLPNSAFFALIPLASVLPATTLHRLALLGEKDHVSYLVALSGDLAILAGIAALVLLAIRYSPIALRLLLAGQTGAVALVILSHGYFTSTGTPLDQGIVREFLHRPIQLLPVVTSEVDLWQWGVCALPFLWLVALWRHLPRLIRFQQQPPHKWLLWFSVSCVLCLLSSLGHGFLRPQASSGLSNPLIILATPTGDPQSFGIVPLPSGTTALQRAPDGKRQATNVIIVVLESTGAQHTSLYPPWPATTPYLRKLAARGAVIERAYTTVPHTSKALVGIHCGIYPRFSPAIDEAKTGGIPGVCLAGLLRSQGYATAYFQTAEEGYERRGDLVANFGFEYFVGKESLDGDGFDESSYFGWEDETMVEPALNWAAAQQGPFLLALLTLTAHHPYGVPKNWPMQNFVSNGSANDHLNTVAYVDKTLKHFFEGLATRDLLRNTVVVIVGDHGEAFGEHRRFQHDAVIYEEGLRVPMVWLGPEITPGTRIRGLRQSIDIMPTVLELLGFVGKPAGDGRSIFSTSGHTALVTSCNYRNTCMALHRGHMKYIHHYHKRGPEVYDLSNDPLEQNPVGLQQGDALRSATARMLRVRDRNDARYRLALEGGRALFVSSAAPAILHPVDIQIDDFARIIGFHIETGDDRSVTNRAVMEAGTQVTLVTIYEVIRTPDHGWRLFTHLSGKSYYNRDHVPVEGAHPIDRWKKGQFVIDRHVFGTRPDWPADTLKIYSGLWKPKQNRAELLSETTPIENNAAILGNLTIIQPEADRTSVILHEEPELVTPLSISLGESLLLRQATLDKVHIKGGLKTTLSFLWRTAQKPAANAWLELEIRSTHKKRILHININDLMPLDQWRSGLFVVDPQGIITRTRDQPGKYEVWLSMNNQEGRRPTSGSGLPMSDNQVKVAEYWLSH